MLKTAALVLASAAGLIAVSASADTPTTLLPNSAWWEKVTVTIAGNGTTESCLYETSLKPNGSQACNVSESEASLGKSEEAGSKQEYTRITFERRYTPDAMPVKADLQTGDTLLGGQVMALAIDPRGAVKTCRIVASSGKVTPDYGCDEASAERFHASVGSARPAAHEGYMTILVYGHTDHMV